MSHTVIIRGPSQRDLAKRLIDNAPLGLVITMKPEGRTLDQNAKLWAIISDISRAKPDGRQHTPETWKCLLMQACGHQAHFEIGLSGEPFPVGFRSSRLSKEQMCELITFALQYGDEHGVRWSDQWREQ